MPVRRLEVTVCSIDAGTGIGTGGAGDVEAAVGVVSGRTGDRGAGGSGQVDGDGEVIGLSETGIVVTGDRFGTGRGGGGGTDGVSIGVGGSGVIGIGGRGEARYIDTGEGDFLDAGLHISSGGIDGEILTGSGSLIEDSLRTGSVVDVGTGFQ